jgi:glutamate dehydrogenase (NAD(P)+)
MINKFSSKFIKPLNCLTRFSQFGVTPFNNISKKLSGSVATKQTDKKDHHGEHPVPVEPNFLQMVQLYFDEAFQVLDIPPHYRDIIKPCAATLTVNFPLLRDDGTIEVINAYRAEHSMHYLPTKGYI